MLLKVEVVLIATFFLSTLAALVMTGMLRRYALNRGLLDIPNERSSHAIATPRGGGLAIVMIFVFGLLALKIFYPLSNIWIAFLGASVLVALVGFIDDHGHIPAQWRLIGHFVAAIWALIWLGGFPSIPLFGATYDMGFVGDALAVFGLVWLLNLYNFMDGIDGIAASEAVFVAAAGLLFAVSAQHINLQLVAMLIIGSTLGFLAWNWPPAKIFMGDVGSGFLGIVLGIYGWWAIAEDVITIWTWLIVLGVFVVDATVTLIRRLIKGLKWYEAHRSHTYQYAARRWGHLRVTLAVGLINIMWILPIAYLTNIYRGWGIQLTLLAYSPLVVLVFMLREGKETSQS